MEKYTQLYRDKIQVSELQNATSCCLAILVDRLNYHEDTGVGIIGADRTADGRERVLAGDAPPGPQLGADQQLQLGVGRLSLRDRNHHFAPLSEITFCFAKVGSYILYLNFANSDFLSP